MCVVSLGGGHLERTSGESEMWMWTDEQIESDGSFPFKLVTLWKAGITFFLVHLQSLEYSIVTQDEADVG